MTNLAWFICGSLLFVGVLVIAAGMLLKAVERKTAEYNETASGTITEIREKFKTDDYGVRSEWLHPIVAYYAGGHLYKSETQIGYKPCPYRVNQQVKVKVNTKNPKKFIFLEEDSSRPIAQYVYISGIVLCSLSILLFILYNAS